jgi:hypothetical protein
MFKKYKLFCLSQLFILLLILLTYSSLHDRIEHTSRLFLPTPPSSLKITDSSATAPFVTLSWEPVKGSFSYHLLIASDPFFKKSVIEHTIPPQFNRYHLDDLGLLPGTYYFKIATIDSRLRQGFYSRPITFQL